jgi:hypothetical protein
MGWGTEDPVEPDEIFKNKICNFCLGFTIISLVSGIVMFKIMTDPGT